MADLVGAAIDTSFGQAVALSGRTAIIGAPGRDDGTGAAYKLTIP